MQTCNKCGTLKPLTDFSVDRGRPRKYCKSCGVIASKRWSDENPDKAAANKRRYHEKNRARKYSDHKERRKNLSDSYCREILKQKRGFYSEQITSELINAERALIKLKRKIKEIA